MSVRQNYNYNPLFQAGMSRWDRAESVSEYCEMLYYDWLEYWNSWSIVTLQEYIVYGLESFRLSFTVSILYWFPRYPMLTYRILVYMIFLNSIAMWCFYWRCMRSLDETSNRSLPLRIMVGYPFIYISEDTLVDSLPLSRRRHIQQPLYAVLLVLSIRTNRIHNRTDNHHIPSFQNRRLSLQL